MYVGDQYSMENWGSIQITYLSCSGVKLIFENIFSPECVYDCELVFRPKKPNFLDYRHERKIDRMNFSQ